MSGMSLGSQLKVNKNSVETLYFKSVQKVNYVSSAEIEPQTQYVYKPCFGFLAKFQNTSVSGVYNFCNNEISNNIQSGFVNNDIVLVSSYNFVMSVNVFPNITDHGQQTDQVRVGKEQHSTPILPAPSLLFEASDRFLVWCTMMQRKTHLAALALIV